MKPSETVITTQAIGLIVIVILLTHDVVHDLVSRLLLSAADSHRHGEGAPGAICESLFRSLALPLQVELPLRVESITIEHTLEQAHVLLVFLVRSVVYLYFKVLLEERIRVFEVFEIVFTVETEVTFTGGGLKNQV